MGIFRRHVDPIDGRTRDLNAKLAQIEAQIKKLNHQAAEEPPTEGPRLRSTAHPPGSAHRPGEPIFEEVDQGLKTRPESTPAPLSQGDLGVRKYDLAAVLSRWRASFQNRPVNNPKLVNYLAAGSIHGLRPLRYEKRIARNRFVFLTIILILVLIGIFTVVARRH